MVNPLRGGVKYRVAKSKSENRKRSTSESVQILFKLDQRALDAPTNSSMKPVMEFIASYLDCKVLSYKYKTLHSNISRESLSLSVTSPVKLKPLIDYFKIFPLRGTKYKDYLDWEKIYYMILLKEHLTEAGRSEIKKISLRPPAMNSKRL